MSNMQEFLAGTDPTNSASSFRIISVAPSGIDVLVTDHHHAATWPAGAVAEGEEKGRQEQDGRAGENQGRAESHGRRVRTGGPR